MIDVKEIPIVEPSENIRFRSLLRLDEHVEKHIFDRKEKWSQLFDADLIAEAKREISEGSTDKTSFKKIRKQYYRIAKDKLLQLCEQGQGHLHRYIEKPNLDQMIDQNILPDNACQVVEAWDLATKMQIIAKSFVRNGKFCPYILCSAYRPFPKISGKQIRKKILGHWEQDTQSVFSGIFLVVHDKDDTH
jgi:hypothetical protein